MRCPLLIARREYIENARTRGFWIGIFLMPTILFLSFQVPIWLQKKVTPIRYYVLADQSGSLAPIVETSLERNHQRRMFEALQEYAAKNAAPGGDSNAMPRLEAGDSDSRRALDTFMAQGGKDGFLQRLKLKPNAPPFESPRRLFQQVALPDDLKPAGDITVLARDLKPYLTGEKKISAKGQLADLHAAVLIPRDFEKQIVRPGANSARGKAEPKGVEYWSTDATPDRDETSLLREVQRIVNSEVRRREYLARGMDAAAIREVEQTYVPFANFNPKKSAGKEAVNSTDVIKQWAPSGFVYLLWLSIFVIVQMLLNNTIEEKSNRIIEVLLSSVTPNELMMGKLIGIAAIGMTMVSAWMLSLFGILAWKAGAGSTAGQLLEVMKTTNLIPLFVLYFILGYFFYAAFILSVGSVCNTIKEAQSYVGVLTMILMVPLMTMTYIPKDPNGAVARVMSWIPFFTPFTMMNRANGDPPLWEMVGTLVMLLVCVIGALYMAGKIFRIGVLRTGQPPKILEMIRWLGREKNAAKTAKRE